MELAYVLNNDFLPKDLEHNSVGNILSAYFKSRSALEEEEKRINAEKELEKQKSIGNKKFLIVGSGTEENKMLSLINELDILKYIEIRSMTTQDELVNLYNSLDIFVFPSYRKESLGLVGLEAMACETLVIASKNYGPTDYLIDNKNGMFFEPNNYKELAKKIIQMENLNNEEINKMTKKARNTAIKYDSEKTKNILINIFK